MTAFPVAAGTRQAASMTAATTAVAVRLPRKYVRSPQLLVWSVAGGAMFIVLFRYIFGGSIRFGSLPYVDFLMPGMILTSVLVNGAGTAIGVAEDREQGFFDRLRSLPMPAVPGVERHHHRVTDPDLGMPDASVGSREARQFLRAEGGLGEVDQARSVR
jgi:hypothetical protein